MPHPTIEQLLIQNLQKQNAALEKRCQAFEELLQTKDALISNQNELILNLQTLCDRQQAILDEMDNPKQDGFTMKDSLYEQNFKLHAENARLRKKIELLESSLGVDKLKAQFEAELKKHLHREAKLQKESDRYHQLWQKAVSVVLEYKQHKLNVNYS